MRRFCSAFARSQFATCGCALKCAKHRPGFFRSKLLAVCISNKLPIDFIGSILFYDQPIRFFDQPVNEPIRYDDQPDSCSDIVPHRRRALDQSLCLAGPIERAKYCTKF